MKHIEPFVNVADALVSLDNGGRFYNIFTHANDGLITVGEVSKATHEWDDWAKMILYLDISLSQLKEDERLEIISRFDEKLANIYKDHHSLIMTTDEILGDIPVSKNVLIKGTPLDIQDNTHTIGFSTVTVMVGEVMTLTNVPIEDTYSLYTLPTKLDDLFYLGVNKNGDQFPEGELIMGGVMKKAEQDKEHPTERWFLDVYYFVAAK